MVILDAPSTPLGTSNLMLVSPVGSTLDAAIVSIGGESGRTELAQGLVVFHDAGCVTGALSSRTRILALVLDASLTTGAALVFEADLDRWIASRGADANCFVVQYLTLFPRSADGTIVTGVLASAATTCLVGRTVVMHSAFHLPVWTCQLALLVDDQAVLAATLWLVVHNLTLLVEGARLGRTWVETLAVLGVTCCVLATVPVGLTSSDGLNWRLQWLERAVARWVWAAANMRTPNKALRTLTARLVDDHFTYGIVSAGSSKTAWVSTLASHTRQATWAVKVRLAFSFWDVGDVLYYY